MHDMSREDRGEQLRYTLISDARHVLRGALLLAQLQKGIPDKVH